MELISDSEEGYQVMGAKDWEEALKKFEEEFPI